MTLELSWSPSADALNHHDLNPFLFFFFFSTSLFFCYKKKEDEESTNEII